jgi:hypothetical protein
MLIIFFRLGGRALEIGSVLCFFVAVASCRGLREALDKKIKGVYNLNHKTKPADKTGIRYRQVRRRKI